MADNVPYKYKPSDSALTEKEVLNAVEYQTTKTTWKLKHLSGIVLTAIASPCKYSP